VDRYLTPTPRLREARVLAAAGAARAAIDVSDGLAATVRQLAEASGLGARIDAAAVPVAADARRWFARHGADVVAAAMAASDDYELVVAVPRRGEGRLRAARARTATPLTCIGVLTAAPGCTLVADGVAQPWPDGFAHFAGRTG
jgi:thiamine-monophosphate kinase